MARTHVGAVVQPHVTPIQREITEHGQGVALSEVLAEGPVAVDDLLAQARGGSPAKNSHGLATTLPQKVKTRRAEPIVEVRIPASPDGAPVAHVVRQSTRPRPALPTAATTTLDAVASVAAAPRSSAAPQATAVLTLAISEKSGTLVFQPESLVFPKAGVKASIQTVGGDLSGLSLFVRDQGIVAFDGTKGELSARKKGVTELYAVHGGKMYIVPISVAEDEGAPLDIKVPAALLSLDGVFQPHKQSADYPGIEQATNPVAKATPTSAVARRGPSLSESVAETAKTVVDAARAADRYYNASAPVGYKTVTIQLMDERSAPAKGLIYPVADALVSVVGTEFTGRTDATGHLTIRDMPLHSHFLLRLDDPSGAMHAGMVELTTQDGQDTGVNRLRVMRSFTFDALASVAGVAQNANLGSYCATVVDSVQGGGPTAGVAVSLDQRAAGPYYFNRYGFLDRSLKATGPDGRFCLFNVAPGPAALSLYEGQGFIATLPISIYAGRHVDDTLAVDGEENLTTRLVAMATAAEQLSSDAQAAGSYKPIDMADLIPLGTQDAMAQLDTGLVQTQDALLPAAGRLRTYAQAAEFEPTVYTYPADGKAQVTPLIPLGFVDDMAIYAQVTRNPELGTVLAEYAAPQAAGHDAIAMRLVDQDGHDVGDGWYYSDNPVTKAIFFNVPAGTYALLVETKDGYWLSSETVTVYNETVSYARLGGALSYRAQ